LAFVPSAIQMARLIAFLMNRTLPSPIMVLATPPEW
jgi:hypothetical protein